MKIFFSALAILFIANANAQTDPVITSWLINTTGETGRHYIAGNSTPIDDDFEVNVSQVQYSDANVYISSSGIPSYIIGPYLDGNPSLASDNQWLFKIPRIPVVNAGNQTATPLGPIAVLINGVPVYDYKDGMSFNNEGVWNRDAILNERDGFDCAKGHPSPIFQGPPGMGQLVGGSYHHHQNPSAFNLDIVEISDVCDLYLADGLYVIDPTQHSPLLGYAFDGYPIYGAYGFANEDGSGGITRMISSFKYRDITVRTHYADGTDVTDGPAVNNQYPIGTYREDFEFVEGFGTLDIHNGRMCVTPEYPEGTYAYFTTVDESHNSFFPYVVGPTYYGVVEESNFAGPQGNNVVISEGVTTYNPADFVSDKVASELKVTVFPNPSSDFIAVQLNGFAKENISVELYDSEGRLKKSTSINKGSTIAHIDVRNLYNGTYSIVFVSGNNSITKQAIIVH
ncbi:MAG: YHYH protein [Cryomorphaceae bacterium]|nr:YHYH protein [Cryomorphaceae bacterium]